MTPPVFAASNTGTTYSSFSLQIGAGRTDEGTGYSDWDFDGWVGTDENKLWLKLEGEREDGVSEQDEFWVMYSKAISTFWDFQVGARHDAQPQSLSHIVLGFEGLAPQFYDTEVHLFISDSGDISFRSRHEKEFLFSQSFGIELYIELDVFAQDVPELDVGAGLSSGEFGFQLHYGFTRTFAIYFNIEYERMFSKTADIAQRNNENTDDVITTLGLEFAF